MLFSSEVFLYIFLPVSFLLVHLCPGNSIKNAALALFSLFFYAWAEPVFAVVLLWSSTVDFLLAQLQAKYRNKSGLFLSFSIFLNLGSLLICKYSNFIVENLNLLELHIPEPSFALPLGISFYVFKVLAYQIDVYREDVEPEKNWIDFLLYLSFFQTIMSGPILRYEELQVQLKKRTFDLSGIAEGIHRFCIGLFKKIVIANTAAEIVSKFIITNSGYASVSGLWIALILFAFQIYFDFSGYTDMALGLGKMFGFNFPENFNYPFIAKSTSDFWRRWHISLSSWFNDYIHFPLSMTWRAWGKIGIICSVTITFFLSGLWHGAGWNYILWGLLFVCTINLEMLFINNLLRKIPAFFGHVYLLSILIFSMSLFYFTDLNIWADFWYHAWNQGDLAFWNLETELMVFEHVFWFPLPILFSMPIYPWFMKKIQTVPVLSYSYTLVVNMLILFVCTAILTGNTYQAFLYLKF